MNRFEKPECEVVRFGDTDVIVTSTPPEQPPSEEKPRITTPVIPIF